MNVTVATHMVALEQLVVKVDHVMWHVRANQMRCVVVAVPTRFIRQIVCFKRIILKTNPKTNIAV